MNRRPTVLVTLAATVLTASGCAEQPRTRVPPPSSATASATASAGATRPAAPVTPARRARSVAVAEAPRVALLPSGRSVPIRAVGTTPEGVLDVPADIDTAGWWRGGSRLGDPFGSVLVAAHVDSVSQGLGPFAELLTVPPGAHIRVRGASLRRTYVVRSRRLVPQGALTDDSWIYDVSGEARLTLVTCAPPYDHAAGRYRNLAVVTAVPTSPEERR